MGEPPPARVSNLVDRGVSRTFQHVRVVPERTILENAAFGAYAQGRSGMVSGMFGTDRTEEAATFAKAWRALEIVELDGLAHEPASRLAMGQARLLEIARALVSRPRLLLLDEPAAGFRTGEKMKLVTLLHRLKRGGMSVLLVEHDMDLVMNCVDRVVVLDRGQGLVTGVSDDVRRDERVIGAYFGGLIMPELRVSGLNVGYDRATVIESLDLIVKSGELVTVLGANGAGKTTLLNGIMGLAPPRAGSITLDGEDLAGLRPEQLVGRGVVLVPERRELFGNLPVEVNLRLGGYRTGASAKALERIYTLFPILAERRRQKAGTLSGGEQQMLAVGRALMAEPRLLMLDEPSIGLAPLIVQEILRVVGQLKADGLTIILVEQNARLALSVADRGYVLEVGRIVLEGASRSLSADQRLSQAYLGGPADYAAARDQVYVD
jgi:branched-chain amino acid transport system ATP-binding protein